MRFMMSRLHITAAQRRLLVAVLLALGLAFAFPAASEAHAILLRSDPAKDAVLPVAPSQVRMWFSEALNPAFSTAVVVNGANKRVDIGNALVSPSDPTEMDVTLKPNLPPAVYVVIYRTDSNVDGHILTGSFLFSVARPDGTVPTLSPGAHPGVNALGGGNLSGQYTGQLDGPTLFNLIMITLVELGAVFWVGAQLWLLFVLQPSSEDHEELNESNRQVQQRFEQRFALPTLLVLLLANVGVLLGQAINITGGNVATAFAPTLLGGLVASGQFGTFWLVRVIVIVLAIRLSLYRLQAYRLRPGTLTRHYAPLLFTLGGGRRDHHGRDRSVQRHRSPVFVGTVAHDCLWTGAGRQGDAGWWAALDQCHPRPAAAATPEKRVSEVCLR